MCWRNFNTGLTNTYINGILVDAGTVYVGTGGAGVWKRSVSEIVGTHEIAFNNDDIVIYPNPTTSRVTLSFRKNVNETKTITLLNCTGQKIFQQLLDKSSGTAIQMDASNLSPGIYLLHIQTEQGLLAKKLIVD